MAGNVSWPSGVWLKFTTSAELLSTPSRLTVAVVAAPSARNGRARSITSSGPSLSRTSRSIGAVEATTVPLARTSPFKVAI